MPDMYLAAKAVNYRMLKNKYDGNSPLLISANYQRTDDGKLCIDIDGDHPLEHGATEMFFKLHDTLEECGIKGIEELPDEYETRIGGSGGGVAVTSAAKTPSSQKTMKRSESSGKKEERQQQEEFDKEEIKRRKDTCRERGAGVGRASYARRASSQGTLPQTLAQECVAPSYADADIPTAPIIDKTR